MVPQVRHSDRDKRVQGILDYPFKQVPPSMYPVKHLPPFYILRAHVCSQPYTTKLSLQPRREKVGRTGTGPEQRCSFRLSSTTVKRRCGDPDRTVGLGLVYS